jgi:hypothetical protein
MGDRRRLPLRGGRVAALERLPDPPRRGRGERRDRLHLLPAGDVVEGGRAGRDAGGDDLEHPRVPQVRGDDPAGDDDEAGHRVAGRRGYARSGGATPAGSRRPRPPAASTPRQPAGVGEPDRRGGDPGEAVLGGGPAPCGSPVTASLLWCAVLLAAFVPLTTVRYARIARWPPAAGHRVWWSSPGGHPFGRTVDTNRHGARR